jgi:hypothetical protein
LPKHKNLEKITKRGGESSVPEGVERPWEKRRCWIFKKLLLLAATGPEVEEDEEEEENG